MPKKWIALSHCIGLHHKSLQSCETNSRLSSSKALLFGWTCTDLLGLLLLEGVKGVVSLNYYNRSLCPGNIRSHWPDWKVIDSHSVVSFYRDYLLCIAIINKTSQHITYSYGIQKPFNIRLSPSGTVSAELLAASLIFRDNRRKLNTLVHTGVQL